MQWAEFYDFKTIKNTISVLKPNNALFEIRAISKGKRKTVVSGYFTDADTLISKFDGIDPRGANIYITINSVKDDCYAREQHDCFRQTDATTHDHEIKAYDWLFIDLDPVRLSEISSSDAELRKAQKLSDAIYEYLKDFGFEEPVRAMSGNGYHLLYKVDLPNTEDNKKIIERCLTVLADMFDTDDVKVDRVNHNPSRICKLYGTLAQKGANTKSRPHRMSKLLSVPQEVRENDISVLQALAAELPQIEPVKAKRIGRVPGIEFDLESWMSEHGLVWIRKDDGTNCDIYPLQNCPFDPSHTNGDSKIFHYMDGAIAFKCHHNSCRGKKWQDVRELLEPGAYDRINEDKEAEERIEAGWEEHKNLKQYIVSKVTTDPDEVRESLPKLKAISAATLQKMEFGDRYYAVDGMIPEGETIIAAPPKTGKSWLMLDMCLHIAEGTDFLTFKTRKSDTLYLALEDGDSFEQDRLNMVLNGEPAPDNFHFVFSGTMPMNEGFLLQLDELLKSYPDVKVVVIDTLQFIKYRQARSESAYECDYRTGRDLKQYAEEHKLAIVVVTHTTKMKHIDDDMADVSGTNGVTGAADAIIVLNKDNRMDADARMFITGRKVRQSMHKIHFDDMQCRWKYMGLADLDQDLQERAEREIEYKGSLIRDVVIQIADSISDPWSGRAGAIIEEAAKRKIGLRESNKEVGGFLNKMLGLFMAVDAVQVEKVKNGTGPWIYKIYPREAQEIPFEDDCDTKTTIDDH